MAYTYRRAISIVHAKVPSNQTNFPVLVSGTYSWLATVANGGRVQHASGFDIAFFSDVGLGSPLKFERVSWTATGVVEFWVKLPSVSSSSDTTFYVGYGDAGISSDQQDAANVWTNSFSYVFHLGDGVTLSAADSTGNSSVGTITGAVAAAGQISGGASFNAPTSSDKILTNGVVEPDDATYSIWFKSSQTGEASGAPRFWSKSTDTGRPLGAVQMLIDQVDGSGAGLPAVASIVFYKSFTVSPGYWYIARPSNNWHKLDITYNRTSAANDPLMYLDGAPATVTEWASGAPSGSPDNDDSGTGNFGIGNRILTNDRGYGGLLDEFRVASVIRSADWLLASYNNETDPSTFYQVGTETLGRRFLLVRR